jgi:enolase-phosphatase E1
MSISLPRPRILLSDIEGTTSSLHFVKEILFPYAYRHLERYVVDHADEPAVRQSLRETAETLGQEDPGLSACSRAELIEALLTWIEQDRKHTGLKRLQGLVWKQGFEGGEFKGHLYADVAPAFRAWSDAGISLGIYSSGSVQAQQLYFGHSEAGDLQPLLRHWFDTENAGPKRELQSYLNILCQLGVPGGEVVFLSDIGAELDAAQLAGIHTVQLLRGPETERADKHPAVASFAEISFIQ